MEGLGLTLVATLVLVAPGAALYLGVRRLSGWSVAAGRDVGEALLYGIGLSVAFWPLLLLFVSLVGLRFVPLFLWVVLLGSLMAVVALGKAGLRGRWGASGELWVAVALLGMTLLALFFRLNDVRGVAVPLFGDSLHHTMVTTIIADTGRVPQGYQPFVPVETFTYHFGFHTLAAVLAQLAGAEPARAVLVMGQVLMAASVPLAFLLGRLLFSSAEAGLATALLVGFASVMPGYYVNWGRYTQLAGLTLLPVALAMLVRVFSPRARGYEVGLSAFCVAGIAVVHYRVLIFYALFGIALAGLHLASRWGNWREVFRAWGRGLVSTGAGLALALPWLLNIYVNYFGGLVQRLQTVSAEYIASYNSDENFRSYVGLALPAIAALGLVVALVLLVRRWGLRGREEPEQEVGALWAPVAALALATWAGLMVASIWVVPGAIGSYTVALTLYLPLALLGGYGLACVAEMAAGRLRLPAWVVPLGILAAAPVLAVAFGTWHLVDLKWGYVREADLRAFDWVRQETPPGSKFLIASKISYAGRGVTASDSGMWLPLIAGRSVSVPALAAWTERPTEPEFFTDARRLAMLTQPPGDPEIARWIAAGIISAPVSLSDPRLLEEMRQAGITHVFVGTTGGASERRIDPAAISADACHYRRIYPPAGARDEGVYVFEVLYRECG